MPLSTSDIDQMQSNQYQQDTALQNFYNQNATNATNQYNTAYNSSNQAQNDLSNFTKNMVSGNDAYQKQLQLANQNAGYDVNNLNQAQNQVSQLTGILGGLPRALQASNANYGATAANVANQYATTGANLSQSLQLANQNAQNQIAKQQAGLTGAQQGTQAVLSAQDQQRQAYTATANNAAQVMATAQAQMQAMITAQQQGQQITAKDQETFGNLRQAYAAAAASYAQANLYAKQAEAAALQNQQTQNYMDSQAYQDYLNGNGSSNTANGTTTQYGDYAPGTSKVTQSNGNVFFTPNF